MSYYAWDSAHEPVQEVTPSPGSAASGLGAYYAWNSAHEPVVPISGLGDTEESKFADEALRAWVDRRPPIAVVGEWAVQQTDNRWVDAPKETALTLLPLTDRDLARARHAAFGVEVRVIAVLHARPQSQADQALMFVGTPYEPRLALAVYALDDARPVAVPSFVTFATIRDIADTDRGAGSVERAAARLGGRLVYAISLPKTPNQRAPGAPFQAVFEQIGLAATELPLPAAPTSPVAAPSAVSIVPWFLGGTLVAGAVWLALARKG